MNLRGVFLNSLKTRVLVFTILCLGISGCGSLKLNFIAHKVAYVQLTEEVPQKSVLRGKVKEEDCGWFIFNFIEFSQPSVDDTFATLKRDNITHLKNFSISTPTNTRWLGGLFGYNCVEIQAEAYR